MPPLKREPQNPHEIAGHCGTCYPDVCVVEHEDRRVTGARQPAKHKQ